MGLKSLLIVMMIFGTVNTNTSIIFSFLVLILSSIFILGKNFFLKHNYIFTFSILATTIAAALLSIYISLHFPIWQEENKKLIFLLPLVPICLLEYRNFPRKYIFSNVKIFLQVLIFIGILKELISYGSIFGLNIFKGYEGILFFDKQSGTLLLIALALGIYEKLGDAR